jgi:anti-sigma factor RsiW
MNDKEWTLDLQAYVDGELEPSRRSDVERVLAGDAEARELVAALRSLGEVVRAHEPIARVPETREFYWSQIQRRIDQEATSDARRADGATRAAGWLRWLVPALGVAAVVVVVSLNRRGSGPVVEVASATIDDAVGMTFRSDTDGVTVHWLR